MRARWLAALALVTLVAACKREPSFEERYAGAEKSIREKAGELDRDMTKRGSEAQRMMPEPTGDGGEPGEGAI